MSSKLNDKKLNSIVVNKNNCVEKKPYKNPFESSSESENEINNQVFSKSDAQINSERVKFKSQFESDSDGDSNGYSENHSDSDDNSDDGDVEFESDSDDNDGDVEFETDSDDNDNGEIETDSHELPACVYCLSNKKVSPTGRMVHNLKGTNKQRFFCKKCKKDFYIGKRIAKEESKFDNKIKTYLDCPHCKNNYAVKKTHKTNSGVQSYKCVRCRLTYHENGHIVPIRKAKDLSTESYKKTRPNLKGVVSEVCPSCGSNEYVISDGFKDHKKKQREWICKIHGSVNGIKRKIANPKPEFCEKCKSKKGFYSKGFSYYKGIRTRQRFECKSCGTSHSITIKK
ncbi:hypothetical protein ACTA71_002955 [Dictyostelium dimigraforme]